MTATTTRSTRSGGVKPPRPPFCADAALFADACAGRIDPLDWRIGSLERMLRAVEAGDLPGALAEVLDIHGMVRRLRTAMAEYEKQRTNAIREQDSLEQRAFAACRE